MALPWMLNKSADADGTEYFVLLRGCAAWDDEPAASCIRGHSGDMDDSDAFRGTVFPVRTVLLLGAESLKMAEKSTFS